MLAKVKNHEISIIIEKAKNDKVVVWGTFFGKDGKSFKRYFDDVEKACKYYNKQIDKAVKRYLDITGGGK